MRRVTPNEEMTTVPALPQQTSPQPSLPNNPPSEAQFSANLYIADLTRLPTIRKFPISSITDQIVKLRLSLTALTETFINNPKKDELLTQEHELDIRK